MTTYTLEIKEGSHKRHMEINEPKDLWKYEKFMMFWAWQNLDSMKITKHKQGKTQVIFEREN